MDMHYCDIFGDCYHCPVAFCPYEKLERDWDDDSRKDDDKEEEDE